MKMFCSGAKFNMNVKDFVACIGSIFVQLCQWTANFFHTFSILMLKELHNYWLGSLLQGLRPDFLVLLDQSNLKIWISFPALESWWPEKSKNALNDDKSLFSTSFSSKNTWCTQLIETTRKRLFSEERWFLIVTSTSLYFHRWKLVIHIISLDLQFLIDQTRHGVIFAIGDSSKF